MNPNTPPLQWDIFCRVIDNFGDIGVCWRLAHILQHDYGQIVRLWVDQPAALTALHPSVNAALNQQWVQNIQVCIWSDQPHSFAQQHFAQPQLPHMVIEAFGCDLPAPFVLAMQRTQPQPIWINLEYFSAEPWVAGVHGLPSKQANGMDKYFFFPSVLPHTGGLMRETNLLSLRDAFISQQDTYQAWCKAFNVPLPLKNHFKISLFAYQNSALTALFTLWATGSEPVQVYLPQGQLLPLAQAYFDQPLHAGQTVVTGQLTLHVLAFLPQSEYDKLLWLCDLNFVRGEESMVRAQWAAKPFIWHIYPTDDLAHFDKLAAFLDVYTQTLNPTARAALVEFMQQWNHQTIESTSWSAFRQAWPTLTQHSAAWVSYLDNLGELTANLVKMVQSKR